jgi:hypothetical protein
MDDVLEQYMAQLGVLVTSHPKQHIWMDQAFASWAGWPDFMLLGYDHTDIDDLPIARWTPPITESFVTGKPAGYYGHYRGELWQLKQGAEILRQRGFKYIYKTAADNTCYRWRNLKRIFKLLLGKRYDLIICGTTQIFGKLDVFCRCMDLWSEKITRCGGAEMFLNHCIRQLEPRVCYQKVGWWNEVLGLIHLQGEYAVNTGLTIFDTWAIGQRWGGLYPHPDLDPRLQFLNATIRSKYERAIRENETGAGPHGPLLPDIEM